ncbi:MAG TPA: DUF5615 family PIN-like protein [Ktedonobacterales bacterium]|nr:DUF5615 family PIN-like protein [Ktedonobacterales bacterium]
MRIKFLLDEHLPPDLVAAVRREQSEVDILRAGMEGAPPLGSKDPDLLVFCEADQLVLVTDNRKSMPGHVRDHFAAGRHHWGIFKIRRSLSSGQMVEELLMFWGASDAEEWIDRTEFLPY